MKTLTINAALIRGAQACQANKDVRYYLNGFLAAANGDIVGTNGHILFKGAAPNTYEKPEQDTILQIDGKIPVSADTVTFAFNDDNNGVCTTDTGKAFTFKVIDGKFPDYQRVIPKRHRSQHSDGFGCRAQYLAKVLAVFGKAANVNVYPATENDQILITYAGGCNSEALEGSVFVVMPCKTTGDFEPLYLNPRG